MDDETHWQHHRLLYWLAVAILAVQALVVILLILRP